MQVSMGGGSRVFVRACAVLVLIGAVFASCGGDGDDDAASTPTAPPVTGSVSVLGIWETQELASFQAMVDPWQTRESAVMEFTGTRDITGVLSSRVQGGDPPDVAMPAEIGLFHQFARDGRLTPLSACPGLDEYVRANYPPSFVGLGTVDGQLYGFFMKADSKATIFYNPKTLARLNEMPLTASASFNDLLAMTDRLAAQEYSAW